MTLSAALSQNFELIFRNSALISHAGVKAVMRAVSRLFSHVLMFALVVSLVARAGVPTGWMLAEDGDGQTSLQICSGNAGMWDPKTDPEIMSYLTSVSQMLDLDDPSDPQDMPDDGAMSAGTCPFSLSGFSSDFSGVGFPQLPVQYADTFSYRLPARAPPVLRELNAQVSARAPPLHV